MWNSKKWAKFFMIGCFVNFGLQIILAVLGDFDIGAISGWSMASIYAMDRYHGINAL